MKTENQQNKNQLRALLEHVATEIIKGVKHGHFDFRVRCQGNPNGARNVDFSAGLSHRYVVGPDDIPHNVAPQLTFEKKADYQPVQQMVTSENDARADTEHSNGSEPR